MEKLNFNIGFNYKESTIEIRDNNLYIDNNKIDIAQKLHSLLSNKILMNKIIDLYVEKLNKIPSLYFKKLKFDSLVSEINYLLSAKTIILSLKELNSTGQKWRNSHRSKSASELLEEKVNDLIRTKLKCGQGYSSTYYEKFSDPQRWTLYIVSSGHIGCQLDSWNFHDLVNPINSSVVKVRLKGKEFLKFNFKKHGVDKKIIMKKVKEMEHTTIVKAENFKNFKEVAGNDILWWSSQMIIARCKKHNITNDFPNCWIDAVKKDLKKKGIKVAPPALKTTSSHGAIEKYKNDGELTGEELITVFKNTSNGNAWEVVSKMDVDTCIALLDIDSKNVSEKLIDTSYNRKSPQRSLEIIVGKVASGPTLSDLEEIEARSYDFKSPFIKLVNYFYKNEISLATWELLFRHVKELRADQYFSLVKDIRLNFTEMIPDEFFDEILSKLDKKHWFTTNSSQSHAFLKRMNIEELERILFMTEFNDDMAIDFNESAILFKDVPYDIIKQFIKKNDQRWDYFIDRIVTANDKEYAREILLTKNHCNPSEKEVKLYLMFSFSEKVELISERSINCNLKEIFTGELEQLLEECIGNEKVTGYIDEIGEIKSGRLNDLIRNIDSPQLPLNSTLVAKLKKESLLKILKQGCFHEASKRNRYSFYGRGDDYGESSALALAYSSLTPADYSDTFPGKPITEHRHRDYLAHLMTAEEIVECSKLSYNFLRRNLDRVPLAYLEKYKNREEFKELVGDRRKKFNNSFAVKLEDRLKEAA